MEQVARQVFLSLSFVVMAQADAATIFSLGSWIDDQTTYSVANGVSSDGSVIAGAGRPGGDASLAYRLQDGAATSISFVPPEELGVSSNSANAVSADGSTLVGASRDPDGLNPRAFKYQNGVITGLGSLPGGLLSSDAWDVSADGAVIVGRVGRTSGEREGFVYKNGLMTSIGELSGGSHFSAAYGVSPDGQIVVGTSQGANGAEAIIYKDDVLTGIGDLVGFGSVAWAVNDAGDLVGSRNGEISGTEAYILRNGVAIGLGDLEGGEDDSVAYGLTADGARVVGHGHFEETLFQFLHIKTRIATLWEENEAGDYDLYELQDYLLLRGLDITEYGWTNLMSANDISLDGNFIVGHGERNGLIEGFVVDLGELTAVPIPSSILLLLSGIGGLLGIKRKFGVT